MNNFSKYKNNLIISVALILLSLIVGFTNIGRTALRTSERVIGDVLSPVVRVVGVVGNGAVRFGREVISLPKVYEENKQMEEELAYLRSENLKLNDIIARTDFLRDEARLVSETKYDIVKSNVIGKGDGNWFSKILIDKGLSDGIKVGDTVVTAIDSANGVVVEGLVGKVEEVGDNWANVDSIISEGNSISFKNIRTQDGGIVKGNAQGNLKGFTYDNYADIVVNDRLYTSGIGDLYKGDLLIGTIVNVSSDEEAMIKEVEATPAIDFKKIYTVYVIKD